jgi:hypothetical protein
MTVEQMIEELRHMPPTAIVVARIRYNVVQSFPLCELYEFRDAPIEGAIYDLGEVYLQLDENGERETSQIRDAARGVGKR